MPNPVTPNSYLQNPKFYLQYIQNKTMHMMNVHQTK